MTLSEIGARPLTGPAAITTVIPAGEPVQLENDASWIELDQVLVRWRGRSWLITCDDALDRVVSLITVRLRETPPLSWS